MVENAKIQNYKWDILGNFQTMYQMLMHWVNYFQI